MFNPEEFGFKSIDGGSRGGLSKDYCYLRITKKPKNDHRGMSTRLVLDEETSDCAVELFGERVNVAVDDSGRIVLYKGKSRKLATMGKTTKKTISLCTSECDYLSEMFGVGTYTEYIPKIWAKGEAILLTPKNNMEGKA